MSNPFELLSMVVRCHVCRRFGQEFVDAFSTVFGITSDACEVKTAGIVCSLFLSVFLEKFPTERLHAFVRNARDEVAFFSFDCNSYETLYKAVGSKKILLLDKDGKYIEREIEKNLIFEAFDFYTNR